MVLILRLICIIRKLTFFNYFVTIQKDPIQLTERTSAGPSKKKVSLTTGGVQEKVPVPLMTGGVQEKVSHIKRL